jgi:hypothetical protein
VRLDLHLRQPALRLPPGYDPEDRDDPGYFRLDDAGQRVASAIMARAGLLDAAVTVAWPPPPAAGSRAAAVLGVVDVERAGGQGDRAALPTEAERLDAAAHLDALDALREVRSPDPARVPAIKFQTAAAWVVDAAECRLIGAGLRRALEAQGAALWAGLGLDDATAAAWLAQWVLFNDLGAACGGYLVE